MNKWSGEMIYPLTRKNVDFYVKEVLKAGRQGKTIESFLLFHDIRMSKWNKYAQKHKPIRKAMLDAQEFCKAKAIDSVSEMINNKDLNGTIAKMYLENVAGWGVNADLTDQIRPQIIIKPGKTSAQLREEAKKNESSKQAK